MKSIIYTFFLIITYFSFSQSTEEVDKFEVNFYGNKFSLAAESNHNKEDSSSLISNGKILSSCPKKGCWVKVISDSEEIFVTFKDYSFFVPKSGIAGKNIIIKGKIKIDTISVSQLKHYAFDAGESEDYISNITTPEITKSIIAEGVAIIN
tara:strand:- start:4083 stop:4535 length:453 start_codon:yes stop_codon:yes gene_type:complete